MKKMLMGLIGSKKAAAAGAGVVMSVVGRKVGLDETSVQSIIAAIIAYIIGQGIADHGKEAAKVKDEA